MTSLHRLVAGTDTVPILERFSVARAQTERLAAPLSPEDQQIQSMPDCSPTKWHRAHTTWFFETFLLGAQSDYRPFQPLYRFLFNSYYEAVGPRHPRPSRGLLSRPSAEEIGRYRVAVDEAVAALIGGGLVEDMATILELGLNHEQQHQELILTDIKHALWSNPLRPAYADRPAPPAGSIPNLEWLELPSGIYESGDAGEGFAFDNERPRHRHYLQAARIASRPVTCGEYLRFIEDGGYMRPEFWLSDGWATIERERWTAPLYWTGEETSWHVFTLFGERPLNPAEPVQHISHYEAAAYAAWTGKRLPTEFEWEVAASRLNAPALSAGRFHTDPIVGPVSLGDVWEWTASPYVSYPGYRPPAGAIGEYNGKFMSNQMVLRGSSWATPDGHARLTYRNFFPSAARWQASGFRLAEDA